jgi:hypothetical protein
VTTSSSDSVSSTGVAERAPSSSGHSVSPVGDESAMREWAAELLERDATARGTPHRAAGRLYDPDALASPGRPHLIGRYLRLLHCHEPAEGGDGSVPGRVVEPEVGEPAFGAESDGATDLAVPGAGPVAEVSCRQVRPGPSSGLGVGCLPGVFEAVAPVTTHATNISSCWYGKRADARHPPT